MLPPAPSPTRSTRPPLPGQRSPRRVWNGTGSTSAFATFVSLSTTGPTWSSAAPWSSASSRPSRTSGSTTPPGDLTRPRNLTALAALTSTATVTARVRQALTDMTGEIADLSHRVRDLDAAIREPVTPLAPALLQVTGISHNSAGVLIAEIGDITRFTSSAKLARYAGCAPIPVYSADKQRHRLHRGGNRRINSVLYTADIVQKRRVPAARELLARHEPGKGSRGARRILQRHLADVIYRAMIADQATWQHQITRHQLAA